MRLYIGKQAVEPALGSVTLSKTRQQAAATLTATVLTAPADTYFLHLTAAVGDPVRLLDDGGAEIFLGSIHQLDRTKDAFRLTAYDRGIYLTKNQISGFFTGTGEQIARKLAAKLGVPTGTIQSDSPWQALRAGPGRTAFSLLRQAVGEKREISMADGRLTVTKSGFIVWTVAPETVLSLSASAGIGDMVNRCQVIRRNGVVAATAENSSDKQRYGQFQLVRARRDDRSQALARSQLRGLSRTGRVTLLGNLGYRCGGAVELHRPDWGLDGVYAVTAHEHRWSEGLFTTTLELEWIR